MKKGDLVVRKSHGKDVLFRIVDILEDENGKKNAVLKGINFRLLADSPIDDLEQIREDEATNYVFSKRIENLFERILKERADRQRKYKRSDEGFGNPGRVLHLDGDAEYLKICLEAYQKLQIEAVGMVVAESDQHKVVRSLLKEHSPDILVVTGHDAILNFSGDFKDISNYRNSLNFIKAVKEARKYEPNIDDLVIFAGACQSHFEALLKSGANFASSPHRILIHCLDPVLVVEKIAYARINTVIMLKEILESTITGTKGVGGLETRGKYRMGMPKSLYE
ncbi:spore coat assemly protein [Alkalithermobacter thermoalcaliphilus JW-YL-7 = DSM 7308]|uniref:Spore coat assemly protein n=1 Tax=Alkalithermobacter thermoalcaliphilus JW-YL-7 = DSM 7308 TaxID=1121328 RepID=A0A150FML6_CLOPD|nr:sporulation peptidase YabG [[Clostridium] paradoxum JW-YL-7 = DSM 7308]SHL21643.1 spore coat assemly protein [[Clostridium] paradoxum JW-YL-7 = DSM 7308]